MLSKNKIKLIRSLDQKKNREAEGLFAAEGRKMVLDLIRSHYLPVEIFCIPELAGEIGNLVPDLISVTPKKELERISSLKSTPDIIALFAIPVAALDWEEIQNDLTLVLDSVQDPGNLGTIIRTADWFGIKNVVCSEDTVDVYNPKVIQSTMGAIARVKTHYLDLNDFLSEVKNRKLEIFGTFMEGENVYKTNLPKKALVIMGNEGKGISSSIEQYINKRISIPAFPSADHGLESLNVAVAASIICSEFRRRWL
jgi:TrmH family RNA methyltransferase